MMTVAALAILMLLAVLVLTSQKARRHGNLHGGTAYCPPPQPANPPAPPRREVYVLSGSPSPTTREPRPPSPAPMPGRPRPQPIRVLIAHETCPVCGHRGHAAHVGSDDDEQTVLDGRGGGR